MNHTQLKQELQNGGYTCVAFDQNGLYYSSFARGVAPLAELCEKNTSHVPLYVADKIIGKAAALLCVKCRITMLYTPVITHSALTVLQSHDISVKCDQKVEYIKNRTGTGKCPMEQLADSVELPEQMYNRVKAFLADR